MVAFALVALLSVGCEDETGQAAPDFGNYDGGGEDAGVAGDSGGDLPTDTATGPHPDASSDGSAPAADSASPSSWQVAWATRDYDTIRSWYRQNTGIAASGLTDADLTPSGTISSSAVGQVIEGLLVSGQIVIRHDNVTVRDCKIVGSSIGVNVPYAARDAVTEFYVQNTSIIGHPDYPAKTGEAADRGIGGTYARVHAERVYVAHRGAGIRLGNSGGDTVTLSMVEDIVHVPPAHNTGISYRGGAGVRLTKNWVEGSTSSALSLYPDASAITDHTSTQNLFDGGTYSILGGTGKKYASDLRDIKFLDNLFTNNYQYGVLAAWCGSCPGNQWTGNKFLDGSQAGPTP